MEILRFWTVTPVTEIIGEEIEIDGDIEVPEEEDNEIDRIAESIELAIRPLRDNVKSLVASLEEDPERFNAVAQKVANALDDFNREMDAALNKISNITGVEGASEVVGEVEMSSGE